MKDLLSGLNPEQRDAASTIEGPLLVLAGAGTGKTKVITTRIAHMIASHIPPESILGVTFTNKAAKEMRDRLQAMIGYESARRVTLGTFHSFCGRVLRREIHLVGHFNEHFSIADTQDQTSIIRQAAAELGYSKDDTPTAVAASYIGNCKNHLISPQAALEAQHPNEIERALAEIYVRYQELLEVQNTVDFDDMLVLTLRLFEEHPDILKKYQDIYRYLLVDEYQDTNLAQFRILQCLAGQNRNICVVGDDDQSIYAWRGADVTNILDFPNLFPGAKEIKLEQNYRSTNKILQAANAVISRNSNRYDKSLWSAKGDGDNIKVVVLPNGEEEAVFVADAINQYLSANPDRCYSDCAILYRSNFMSRVFEQEFRRRGIRPKIIGGQEFFQRKEVKDAASYLKILLNERDEQSLLRVISVPPRGIGDKAILALRSLNQKSHIPMASLLTSDAYKAAVSSAAAKSAHALGDVFAKYRGQFQTPGNLSQKVTAFLEEVGYLNGFQRLYKDIREAETRRDNVLEFINYIGEFEHRRDRSEPCTLEAFMENYSLMDDTDRTEDDDRDAPIMSTVHAAKGLEFPCVFIVGMEQNLFPHERALSEGSEDEERRLFYVAITRAKENLLITLTRERFRFGQYERCMPSAFLKDIPDDLADKPDPESFFPQLTNEQLADAYSQIMKAFDDDF